MIILLAALSLGSSLAFADTRIHCVAPLGAEVGERAGVDLLILESGQISGSTFGMMWNGFHRTHVEFNFEVPSFKPTKDGVGLSSGELHRDPPRYGLQPDQTLDIDRRSVSVILVTFKGPYLTGTSPFKAELFYYQRYFLHDLFIDGGQFYSLECVKDRA